MTLSNLGMLASWFCVKYANGWYVVWSCAWTVCFTLLTAGRQYVMLENVSKWRKEWTSSSQKAIEDVDEKKKDE